MDSGNTPGTPWHRASTSNYLLIYKWVMNEYTLAPVPGGGKGETCNLSFPWWHLSLRQKSSQLSLSFLSYEMGSCGNWIAYSIKYLPLVKAGLCDTADHCREEIGSSCPVLTLNRSQWSKCVNSSLCPQFGPPENEQIGPGYLEFRSVQWLCSHLWHWDRTMV